MQEVIKIEQKMVDEHFGGHHFGGHHLVGALFWWENFFGEAHLVDENLVLVKSLWWENSIWWEQKSGQVSQILVELRQLQDPSVLWIRV